MLIGIYEKWKPSYIGVVIYNTDFDISELSQVIYALTPSFIKHINCPLIKGLGYEICGFTYNFIRPAKSIVVGGN